MPTTYSYAPAFLANAAMGGSGSKITFAAARPFFLANRSRLRTNWRQTDTPADRDFGAGAEPTYVCMCNRTLPLIVGQVDHVAADAALRTATASPSRGSGERPAAVALDHEDAGNAVLPNPLMKQVAVDVRRGAVSQITVRYVVKGRRNPTNQPMDFSADRMAGAIGVGPDGALAEPAGRTVVQVSPGWTAFWVQAFADVPLGQASRVETRAAPHLTARPSVSNPLMSVGEAYFEFQTWQEAQTPIRRCAIRERGAKELHDDTRNDTGQTALTIGGLLTTDLTNFQVLCQNCNASKQDNSFSLYQGRNAAEFFRQI